MSEIVSSEFKEFLKHIKLIDIRCVELDARNENSSGLLPERVDFKFDDTLNYNMDNERFICKIGSSLKVLSGEVEIAHVRTAFNLINEIEPAYLAPKEMIEMYLTQNAVFIVYPYVREIMQSTIGRMGLGNFVLNYMLRN